MITDRPCCDNCPHFSLDQAACGEPQVAGLCLYDPPAYILNEKNEPKVVYYHVSSSHRCSNHPWIEAMSRGLGEDSLQVADYPNEERPRPAWKQSWGYYITLEFPLLRDMINGVTEKATEPSKGGI